MILELICALKSFHDESSVKVIIIKAAGKHFCSGHNLTEMLDGAVTEYKFIFRQCAEMMLLIHEIPQIVIAQIHGVATAAGCQLAAQCDFQSHATLRIWDPRCKDRAVLQHTHGCSEQSGR